MTTSTQLTREQYLMGRDVEYPMTENLEINSAVLLFRVNGLLRAYGQAVPGINSGYRPGRYNVAAGGAPQSCHLTCQAVDLADSDGSLKRWITAHPEVLVEWRLYMEHPDSTPVWCHLQTRPTTNRVFHP